LKVTYDVQVLDDDMLLLLEEEDHVVDMVAIAHTEVLDNALLFHQQKSFSLHQQGTHLLLTN
jgi:hypothetical protein